MPRQRNAINRAVLAALKPAEGQAEAPCLTLEQLEQATGLSNRQVAGSLQRLMLQKRAKRSSHGCYRLADGTDADAPLRIRRPVRKRKDSMRGRFWRTLRICTKVCVSDLVRYAMREGDDEKKVRNGARIYLWALAGAGYLSPLPSAADGETRWMLVRNSGPETPVVRGYHKEIYDHNTGETHPIVRGDQ